MIGIIGMPSSCHPADPPRPRCPGCTELAVPDRVTCGWWCPWCSEAVLASAPVATRPAPAPAGVESTLTWRDAARVVIVTCLLLASIRLMAWWLLAGCWALGRGPWPPPPY